MAAHFDLSRFRNAPPQLAALVTSSTPQEDEMSDSQKTRPRKPDPDEPATAQAPAAAEHAQPDAVSRLGGSATATSRIGPARPSRSGTRRAEARRCASPRRRPAASFASRRRRLLQPRHRQPTAQVIDLDAVRADERRATLAYVGEVHELCALAGRGDLAAGFIAKATPVAQVRRALLEARAAEDEATAIRSQVRPATVEPAQPAIDTAAIYAARNQNVR